MTRAAAYQQLRGPLMEFDAWQRWSGDEFCRYCPHTLESHAVRLFPSHYMVRVTGWGEPRYFTERVAEADISTVHCRRCGSDMGASTAATCFVRRFNIGEIVDAPPWRLRKPMSAHQGQNGTH